MRKPKRSMAGYFNLDLLFSNDEKKDWKEEREEQLSPEAVKRKAAVAEEIAALNQAIIDARPKPEDLPF